MTSTTLVFRRAARVAAGGHNSCPVVIVDGDAAPRLRGDGPYHVTPAGDLCRHPNAYRQHFGRPVYVPSTRRVEVGRDWRPVGGGL